MKTYLIEGNISRCFSLYQTRLIEEGTSADETSFIEEGLSKREFLLRRFWFFRLGQGQTCCESSISSSENLHFRRQSYLQAARNSFPQNQVEGRDGETAFDHVHLHRVHRRHVSKIQIQKRNRETKSYSCEKVSSLSETVKLKNMLLFWSFESTVSKFLKFILGFRKHC